MMRRRDERDDMWSGVRFVLPEVARRKMDEDDAFANLERAMDASGEDRHVSDSDSGEVEERKSTRGVPLRKYHDLRSRLVDWS